MREQRGSRELNKAPLGRPRLVGLQIVWGGGGEGAGPAPRPPPAAPHLSIKPSSIVLSPLAWAWEAFVGSVLLPVWWCWW